MSNNKNYLQNVKNIHFIGCGGSGMYPLIQILQAKGYAISGSDVLEGSILDYERQSGVKVYVPQAAENINGADLVVYSAAISQDNIEIQSAKTQGIPTIERSVLLGEVSRMYKGSICVGGTHGKTTVTSMITTALELAGKDPGAVIGGKLPLINGYGKAGNGDNIVIEACEYSNTFLELSPAYAILLNIDNDHLDFFGSMENLKKAFSDFLKLASKKIVFNADDEQSYDVINALQQSKISYGINTNCDYKAINITQHKPGFYAFDLSEKGKITAHLELFAPGHHNIYNALAMCAVCRDIGLDGNTLAAAAKDFKGAGRRFEIYGTCNGALVVDDYAHHPTELRAVLTTAKNLGYKRVVAVHQPFTFSRTKTLLLEFAEVLSIADKIILTPILGSREIDDGSIKTAHLTQKLKNATEVESLAAAANWVKQNAEEGDLIITLGCGDVYKAAKMMID